MKGQFLPTQKGTSPDKTSLSKVAGVAGGKVDSGNTAKQGVRVPKAQINKHL